MTPEKAKEILFNEWQGFLENNIDYAGVSDAYKLAFKALEQMSVVDDIKSEIVKKHLSIIEKNDFDNGRTYGYEECISIIDSHIGKEEE